MNADAPADRQRSATHSELAREEAALLACPVDHAACTIESAAVRCSQCGTAYPLDGRVVDFLASPDAFYEGLYCNEIKFNPRGGALSELPLWLLVHGYVWAVRKHVAAGSTVVELGCSAGVRWFGSRYRMIGLDLSRGGLEVAQQDYRLCLRGDALRMPLADGSVDAVVSACFFEHFVEADKRRLLAEIHRVLKPGGKIVFQYDLATHNPLIAYYRKRDPELYRATFLEPDGHVGFQSLEENDRIVTESGFAITRSLAMERSPLQMGTVWGKLAKWPGLPGRIAGTMARLSSGKMALPTMALLRGIDETVGRLAPQNWGRIALTIATRD